MILTRNPHIMQIQIAQEKDRPSNYRPDDPPDYDDVINKPDEYPVYHECKIKTIISYRHIKFLAQANVFLI